MRSPSSKTLQRIFMITPRQAGLIKRLTAAADRPGELRNILDRASRQIPGTVQYFYSIGGGSRGTLDHHRHWRRTIILDAVNELVGGYGVISPEVEASVLKLLEKSSAEICLR